MWAGATPLLSQLLVISISTSTIAGSAGSVCRRYLQVRGPVDSAAHVFRDGDNPGIRIDGKGIISTKKIIARVGAGNRQIPGDAVHDRQAAIIGRLDSADGCADWGVIHNAEAVRTGTEYRRRSRYPSWPSGHQRVHSRLPHRSSRSPGR